MKLAFLLIFHKDIEVCRNRIRMLRKYNPGMPIYGIYGGDLKEEETYRRALAGLMDDYYSFDEDKDSDWKWVNFDLMIARWYAQRGKDLDFDSVVRVEWDQLVLSSIKEQFKNLKKGEILFSGMRPAKEVEDWWYWVSKKERDAPAAYGYQTYTDFLNHIKEKYNYSDEPVFSQSFFCIYPRAFLEPFSKLEWPIPGYGEYRMPMYAQVFGVPFCASHQVDTWWPGDPEKSKPPYQERIVESENIPPYAERALTTAGIPLPLKEILKLSAGKNGQKLFHPYYRIYPVGIGDWFRLLRDKILHQRYGE